MKLETCDRCNGRGGFDTIVPYLGITGLCFKCAGAGVQEVQVGTINCGHCHAKHETVTQVRECATGQEAYNHCGGCGDEVVETWKHKRCHLIDA